MQGMKIQSALCALLLLACGAPETPRFYSFSSEFSAEEREVIRDAVAAWCEKTGDCARESMFSENAHFELVDDLPEDERTERDCPEGSKCIVNGNEEGGTVRIARNRAPGLDVLWRIAAHEWGHLCTGHVAGSALMAAYQDHEAGLVVDDEAASAWRAGCR